MNQMSGKQRSDIARNTARARWLKRRKGAR
jgi:hypothetical protein